MFIKYLFRKKETIYYIISFFLMFLLLIVLSYSYKSLIFKIDILKNDYKNRSLIITSDLNLENKIKNINGIEKIYINNSYYTKLNNQNIEIKSYNPYSKIEIIKGREILEDDEILLDEQFSSLYNQNVKITVFSKIYEYKVVGITKQSNYVNNLLLEENDYLVLLYNYESIERVKEELYNINIYASSINNNELYKDNILLNLTKIFISIITLLTMIVIYLLYKNYLNEERKSIELLYNLGYLKRKIIYIYILNLIIMLLISLILSIIFSFLILSLMAIYLLILISIISIILYIIFLNITFKLYL